MVLKPAAYPSVASHTSLELSHETLRSLLGQIEAELYHSDSYQRALSSLQTLLGEAAAGTQILVQAVAREAIGLALKQFIKQYRTFTVPEVISQTVAAPVVPEDATEKAATGAIASTWAVHPSSNVSDAAARQSSHAAWETALEASFAIATPSGAVENFSNPSAPQKSTDKYVPENSSRSRKSNQAELAAQTLEMQRQERLRQIGSELREARGARFLSLQQLQRQTLVPLAHIEALESGNLERLPEDVYVRGFIRRLGDALGLDGASMAASIPAPDPAKYVLPSWLPPASESPGAGTYLRTGHLYLGYAALVVGAVGGLSWLSGQTTPGAVAEPDPATSSPTAVSQSERHAPPKTQPGMKSSRAGVPVWSEVAPPETMAF